jgi:PAS domain-containing protein
MDRIEAPPPLESGMTALLTPAITQMANAVMITGADGRVAWVNDAFCQLCGYARDDLSGATPSILKSDKAPRCTQPYGRTRARTSPCILRTRLLPRCAKYHFFEHDLELAGSAAKAVASDHAP